MTGIDECMRVYREQNGVHATLNLQPINKIDESERQSRLEQVRQAKAQAMARMASRQYSGGLCAYLVIGGMS